MPAKPLLIIAAVTTLGSGLAIPVQTQAGELSASIGVANLYLFRGLNLSNSAPQVHGSIDYAHGSGLYAGIWGSSEGAGGTQEYDVYAGFGGEVGDFSYDINLTAYEYPSVTGTSAGGQASANDFGDFSEIIIGLSGFGVSFTYVDSLQGENTGDADSAGGYTYYSFAYDTDSFGALIGMHDIPGDVEMTHIDLNYYANDELTFTLSQIFDQDPDDTANAPFNDDLLFIVNWSKGFDL